MKCDLVSDKRGWCEGEAKWSFQIPHGIEHGEKESARHVMCDECKAEYEEQVKLVEGQPGVLMICPACKTPVSAVKWITNILPL